MTRKRRFILHIGTEKTGTSTLQAALHAAQDQLRMQGVEYYASVARIEARALAACAVGEKQQDDFLKGEGIESLEQRRLFRERMVQEFNQSMGSLESKVHTVILSSEHFHSRLRQEQQVEWLKKLITPWAADVCVVVYLRPQVDVLTSLYSTALRNRGTQLLEALAKHSCHEKNHYYNYQMLLQLWAKVFGEGNVLVRVFSREELMQGDIVMDFSQLVGISPVPKAALDLSRKNESINAVGQALLRGLNSALLRESSPLPEGIYKELAEEVISNFPGAGQRLSFEFEKKLQHSFVKSNQWVCKKWFAERAALFPPLAKRSKSQRVILAFSTKQLALIKKTIKVLEQPEVRGIPEINMCASYLRDAAVKLEKTDLPAAKKLMLLAQEIRPSGPFIRAKLAEYKAQTNRFDKVLQWMPWRSK